eukprot:Amastigsp_a511734_8.p3 type:complete len:258 gc:universal Amastigsp_a511734_8:183-956(+)
MEPQRLIGASSHPQTCVCAAPECLFLNVPSSQVHEFIRRVLRARSARQRRDACDQGFARTTRASAFFGRRCAPPRNFTRTHASGHCVGIACAERGQRGLFKRASWLNQRAARPLRNAALLGLCKRARNELARQRLDLLARGFDVCLREQPRAERKPSGASCLGGTLDAVGRAEQRSLEAVHETGAVVSAAEEKLAAHTAIGRGVHKHRKHDTVQRQQPLERSARVWQCQPRACGGVDRGDNNDDGTPCGCVVASEKL